MAQSTPPHRSPATWAAASVLLIVGIVGTLWMPIYARSAPRWGNFPFFYWDQLIWVPVVAILTGTCYLLLKMRPALPADTGAAADSNGRLAK